jgi:type I restriction enzyme, S subunit
MSGLPVGWVSAAISDVATVNPPPGKPLPDETEVSFIPMAAVEAESGSIDTSIVRPFGELRRKSFRTFEEGDVLFAKITPCMENGKAAVARNLKLQRGFGSTEFHVLRPHRGINPDFLLRFLLQKQFRDTAARNMKGTAGQLRVPTSYLAESQVPIPPTAEQERIVASIEEQFSRLDAGVGALERVLQNLMRMRDALLHRIVGFELNAKLPTGWEWVTIRDVAGNQSTPVLTGPFGTTLSRSDFRPDGVPVLTIGCLTPHGIRTDLAPRVSETKANTLGRYTLRSGDVLFSRMATVGRAAVVGEAEAGSLINYHLMRLRLDQKIIAPEFLVLLCRGSRAIQSYLLESNHGVTRPGINTKQLLSLPVALPPINEQERVVNIFRAADDSASQLEKEVAHVTARARQLRSSILAAAFSGKLVPQDPADESASTLLQRIKQAASNGQKTTRPRNPRAPREKITA